MAIRHFEYTDEFGERSSGAQNMSHLPRESMDVTIRRMNTLLRITAKAQKWKDIDVYHPNFPKHAIMHRINHIRAKNDQPPTFTAEEIEHAQRPEPEIQIAEFDPVGNPIIRSVTGNAQILPTSVPTVTTATPSAISAAAGVVLTEHPATAPVVPVPAPAV